MGQNGRRGCPPFGSPDRRWGLLQRPDPLGPSCGGRRSVRDFLLGGVLGRCWVPVKLARQGPAHTPLAAAPRFGRARE